MNKLDKLGDILFGEIGDRISKYGICACGLATLLILAGQIWR